MRTKGKKLLAIGLVLMVIFSLGTTAYAHDVPNMTRKGSVTITIRKDGSVVSGGTLTIYRVGEVAENDGNYTFQPTGDFASCGESFENLDSAADIAVRLKAFADEKSISGLSTKEIDTNGSATFRDLQVGLYLIVQNKAAPGYKKLAPFLVSIPYLEDGKYIYDLSANPKTDLEREPVPSPSPTPTPPPTDPSLPQTGQLWWPVPVLACGGLMLFVIGVILNRRKKADED